MGRSFHGPKLLTSLPSAPASRGASWENLRLPGASSTGHEGLSCVQSCLGNITLAGEPQVPPKCGTLA